MNSRKLITFAIATFYAILVTACNLQTGEGNENPGAAQTELAITQQPSATPPPPTTTPTESPTETPTVTPTPQPSVFVSSNWGYTLLLDSPSYINPFKYQHQVLAHVENATTLPVLGQTGECDWFYVETPDGQKGWVSRNVRYDEKSNEYYHDGETKPSFKLEDCEMIRNATFRPYTGLILCQTLCIFPNTKQVISIENRSDQDAYFVLVYLDPLGYHNVISQARRVVGESILGWYVRTGERIESVIPQGNYQLYFVSGKQWEGQKGVFEKDAVYGQMLSPFDIKCLSGCKYQSVELIYGSGGNTSMQEIDPEDFPIP